AWFRGALEQPGYGDMRLGADGIGEFRVTVPVVDPDTQRPLGVIVAYSKAIRLYEFLTSTAGRGKTGERYIMDPSGLLLSPSRFVPDAQFKLKNQGGAFEQAVRNGEEGTGIWPDYRGADVLGYVAFKELKELGLPWVIVAEVDTAEAFASAYTLRNFV